MEGHLVGSQFQRVPREIKYRIFARLGWEDLASAASVCKDWYQLLSQSCLQALSLSFSSVRSPSFLVKINYKPPISKGQTYKEESLFVIIDHEGNHQAQHMLNTLHLMCDEWYGSLDWDISCNGLLVSLSTFFERQIVVVCHPSLKIMKVIPPYPYPSTLSKNYIFHPSFQGASFDPSTSHFILLIGFTYHSQPLVTYQIYIYTSESMKWRIINLRLPSKDRIGFTSSNTAVYSHGFFFWIECFDTSKYNVVGFSLMDKKFDRIPFPKCPIHLNYRHPCFGGSDIANTSSPSIVNWAIKGCDGNLVLVHNISRTINMNRRRNVFSNIENSSSDVKGIAWKLVKSEECRWNWEILDMGLDQKHLPICPSLCMFDIDREGWSLWAEEGVWESIENQKDLIMLDDDGDLRHSVSVSSLLSSVHIPSNCYAFVTAIWAFEMNNLWDLMASS